jgi:hypothetical protein
MEELKIAAGINPVRRLASVVLGEASRLRMARNERDNHPPDPLRSLSTRRPPQRQTIQRQRPCPLAEFFARWMREHAARRCSPRTLEAYGQHGDYAIREFGSVLLTDLTTELLETTLNKLHDAGS